MGCSSLKFINASEIKAGSTSHSGEKQGHAESFLHTQCALWEPHTCGYDVQRGLRRRGEGETPLQHRDLSHPC